MDLNPHLKSEDLQDLQSLAKHDGELQQVLVSCSMQPDVFPASTAAAASAAAAAQVMQQQQGYDQPIPQYQHLHQMQMQAAGQYQYTELQYVQQHHCSGSYGTQQRLQAHAALVAEAAAAAQAYQQGVLEQQHTSGAHAYPGYYSEEQHLHHQQALQDPTLQHTSALTPPAAHQLHHSQQQQEQQEQLSVAAAATYQWQLQQQTYHNSMYHPHAAADAAVLQDQAAPLAAGPALAQAYTQPAAADAAAALHDKPRAAAAALTAGTAAGSYPPMASAAVAGYPAAAANTEEPLPRWQEALAHQLPYLQDSSTTQQQSQLPPHWQHQSQLHLLYPPSAELAAAIAAVAAAPAAAAAAAAAATQGTSSWQGRHNDFSHEDIQIKEKQHPHDPFSLQQHDHVQLLHHQ
jgi:hypothetical protein